jgi:hypothetical protein
MGISTDTDLVLVCVRFDGAAYSLVCHKVLEEEELSGWRFPVVRKDERNFDEQFDCVIPHSGGRRQLGVWHNFTCGGRALSFISERGGGRFSKRGAFKRSILSRFVDVDELEDSQKPIWHEFQKVQAKYLEFIECTTWDKMLVESMEFPTLVVTDHAVYEIYKKTLFRQLLRKGVKSKIRSHGTNEVHEMARILSNEVENHKQYTATKAEEQKRGCFLTRGKNVRMYECDIEPIFAFQFANLVIDGAGYINNDALILKPWLIPVCLPLDMGTN